MDRAAGSDRLAELTIALSLATDLGTGQPMEQGLRTCWLSMQVADALGLDAATRSCVYHVSLLRFIGCTSDASETAALSGGDDVAFNATMAPMLNARPGEGMRYFVGHLGEGLPMIRRAGLVARAMTDPGQGRRSLTGHCEVAALFAARLGLGEAVRHALAHAYERWDGKGYPAGLAGNDVPMAVRVVTAARDAELWTRQAGWAAAAGVLAKRRGHSYDPAVTDALIDGTPGWLDDLGDDPYPAVLDAEPAPKLTIAVDRLDDALGAVADFVDLKSSYLRGHSTGVAGLASSAATAAGSSDAESTAIRRAALLHDVGRVGVASGIWDHPGRLTAEQWERVRLHPYLTDRVLQRSGLLAPFADIASHHHERADGSGYHRGARGEHQPLASRLLAAADAFHAMTEDRPHRPALSRAVAASQLRDEATEGRFSAEDVHAVLDAAGEASHSMRPARPAGLTEREVEVLRLIARGQGNKQVATALGISRKTVGHHVEHIYAKAAVTTRAGATLFAMERGLLS